MSSSSITAKKGMVDDCYIETVDVEATTRPGQPVHRYERIYGNPTPVGMLSYASVILCSSLLTLCAGNVYTPNLLLLFTTLNMYNASVFLTFGAFNFSFGALYILSFGILAAYAPNGIPTEEYYHAIGLFHSVWT
ncbi:hypothetical protein BKA82DRAFT_25178 [Pisolithus tinctorius]|uniref:Uncharacterized protein n=1 Tax=Pisolithus tinctorius Marx 270 TaxID=870435 RepID=A0A0C3JA58_PISTI|nr:hypothetical protein BKA82DRAFT_25178 [Pisolithus tinctorius]KIO05908.1 hypothetical protein M404DRAFT_25178 [Pisolithus tinctorius Marx 270]